METVTAMVTAMAMVTAKVTAAENVANTVQKSMVKPAVALAVTILMEARVLVQILFAPPLFQAHQLPERNAPLEVLETVVVSLTKPQQHI